MLANFPKILFQRKADKCFGICMLINPNATNKGGGGCLELILKTAQKWGLPY
jgi:hypothetical protein